jgi:diacylglycerol kinase (ATP)
MRVAVVLNPAAGAGAAGRALARLEEELRRAPSLAYQVHRTEGRGHATELVREALRGGVDGVAAIGGDGTFNEAINGFFEEGRPVRPEAFFTPIPFGTGGDFRRTLRLTAAGALAALTAGDDRLIDLGWMRCEGPGGAPIERFFLNIASFGLGGKVDQAVETLPKRLGGGVAFYLASLKAGLVFRPPTVRLRFDEEEGTVVQPITNVAVANGQFFGGGMHVAPMALLESGTFEIVTFDGMGPLRLLRLSPQLYKASHLRAHDVRHRQARVVDAEVVEGEALIDLDGEVPGRLPARFEIRPRALKLRV